MILKDICSEKAIKAAEEFINALKSGKIKRLQDPTVKEGNLYKCSSCGAIFRRYSDLKKIKSYCSKADKYVFMKRVKK